MLLRARCALRTGVTENAARDLEDGMQIVERHRARAAAAAGTGILDADHALFAEAIRRIHNRESISVLFAT